MSKLYLLEPGFVEDTILYEVQLTEVARMPKFTADQVVNRLRDIGVRKLVIDASCPSLTERLKCYFLIKKIVRVPRLRKADQDLTNRETKE